MILDLNLIALAVVSSLVIVLTGITVRLKLKLNKSIQVSTQLFVDRVTMQEEIDRLSFINSNSTDLENGFVKFLSESRDQAFEYIEEVQQSIEAIKTAIDLGDDAMIDEAYKKLINFLPNENPDVVN